MNKRKVNVYGYEKNRDAKGYKKIFIGIGTFHQFGCDFEEFEHGIGNFSTAIVEMQDGKILNSPIDLISFLD